MITGMLQDSFQRKFHYLRLSLTDVCNFKCTYCLPNGYQKATNESELSLIEIQRLLRGFADAGFTKVRFTGGEPTTRSDLLSIIEAASSMKRFQKIALSTNGWKLKSMVGDLKRTGLTHLNVSVDTLNEERFQKITAQSRFQEILDGIAMAQETGFQSVKVNAVLHRENAQEDLELFLNWVRTNPISVRFIELMKTGDHAAYFDKNFISSGQIKQRLLSDGWRIIPREKDAGPAVNFVHPDFSGSIGVIAPYSEGFCESCNRLRITSRGQLRLCLFGEKDHSLRSYLQSDELAGELPVRLAELLQEKEVSHYLHQGRVGNVANLSVMGG